jgi:tRNA 5-methylaminomethyl-2-thiouridine biosynthesis bifunctional protein
MDGLYINAGHGAKGLVNAPICAEIVASLINGDPLPVSKSLAGALNPNRFLLREMGLKKLATSLIEPS